jgi:hypothetical protein
MTDDKNNRARPLAKLVRELVRTERYEHLADLTYDLRDRCRRLKLPCDDDAITQAYRLVDSNLPLTKVAARGRRNESRPIPPVVPSVPAHDAREVFVRVCTGVLAWRERR